MARRPEFELLYQAYQEFAQSCLIEDRSLLWPEHALWTPANVSALRHALVDTPAFGKESFEDKLNVQMIGQPSETWGLLADAYYLYCLVPVSSTMKAATKRVGIAKYAQQAHLPVPDEQAKVWQALDSGFCNPGLRYLQKYRQFWLIFIFAEQVKQVSDRQALFKDRKAVQKLLDVSLELVPTAADRGYGMRHALLYLAFPDYYERSVSMTDKTNIVAAFKQRITGAVSSDLDDAIFQIRQVLEKDGTLPQPFSFYNQLVRPMWKNIPLPSHVPAMLPPIPPNTPIPATLPAGQVLDLLTLFNFTKNVILYGPPGTGKTYIANQTAHELVKKQLQVPVPETILLQGIAEAITFYDSLALGIYLAGKEKHYTVKEILELPLIQARFTIRPVNYRNEAVWGYLQSHTSPESKTVKTSYKTEPFLFDKANDSRWYLTPTGESYVEQTLNLELASLKQPTKEVGKAEDFITRVSFHQSYAYEDFVEGFRPTGADEIEVVPGKFREVCAQAGGNPNANYVLIIDEINRGNISKVFGELITLLEDDKRDGQPDSFPIELAYSHLKFKVPGNLYIIGTMNTADRSIALLDVALRRRFAFYELMPDPELLHGRIVQSEDGDQVDLERLLTSLNQRIRKELGPDYQIGHSYLLKVNSLASLEFAWNNQIMPLLHEYFYSQPDLLAEILEPYLRGQENGGDLRREGSDLMAALSELAK
jgi:5-methylcytosine-specific restriction protein B